MTPLKRVVFGGQVTAAEPKFQWKVYGFKKHCSKMKVGDAVNSPKFVTSLVGSNNQWYMMLYPRGETEDCKDFLSLYLHTKFATKIEAVVNFKILNKKAQVVFDCTLKEATFGDVAWGRHKLISTDFILNQANRMLTKGHALTIVCEIRNVPRQKVIELQPNKKVEEQEATFRLEVLDIYEELINDDKFSDVSLISEDRTLRVHKCILSKNSSVFAAMFNAKVKEKQKIVVKIDDIKYDVLVEMIRFVYTRKVNSIEKLVDQLVIAANKYALHRLVIMCEETMIKSISCDTVIDRLLLAHQLKLNKLKIKAIEFIVEKGRDVIEKPKFQLLPYDIVFKVCSSLAKKYKS